MVEQATVSQGICSPSLSVNHFLFFGSHKTPRQILSPGQIHSTRPGPHIAPWLVVEAFTLESESSRCQNRKMSYSLYMNLPSVGFTEPIALLSAAL